MNSSINQPLQTHNRHINRRVGLLALVGMLALPAFAGCSDDVNEPTPDAAPDEPPVETIDPPGPATLHSIGGGTFYGLADYEGIYGHAQVVRAMDGTTTFALSVEGLTPDLEYNVHVHALPCEVDNGGGHYKIDPTVAGTEEANEIWPMFTTDENGIGRAMVSPDHLARMDAQSIVIHDPENAGAKMACANLAVAYDGAELVRSGDMAAFAAAEQVDMNIAGTVTMTTNEAGTNVVVELQGLDMAEMYSAHVHALPCEVDNAGGHYKLDPTNPDTVPDNELWPEIASDAAGNVSYELVDPHRARSDAQSLVIHRMFPDMSNPKVACANLARTNNTQWQTMSTPNALPAGTERYPELDTTANIYRRLDGSTAGYVAAEGLTANQEYVAHVHDYTCNTADGGGHYKIDPTIADTEEANELWLHILTGSDGIGDGIFLVPHMARPEAQSIVIHDHVEDGARLVCIDLD